MFLKREECWLLQPMKTWETILFKYDAISNTVSARNGTYLFTRNYWSHLITFGLMNFKSLWKYGHSKQDWFSYVPKFSPL